MNFIGQNCCNARCRQIFNSTNARNIVFIRHNDYDRKCYYCSNVCVQGFLEVYGECACREPATMANVIPFRIDQVEGLEADDGIANFDPNSEESRERMLAALEQNAQNVGQQDAKMREDIIGFFGNAMKMQEQNNEEPDEKTRAIITNIVHVNFDRHLKQLFSKKGDAKAFDEATELFFYKSCTELKQKLNGSSDEDIKKAHEFLKTEIKKSYTTIRKDIEEMKEMETIKKIAIGTAGVIIGGGIGGRIGLGIAARYGFSTATSIGIGAVIGGGIGGGTAYCFRDEIEKGCKLYSKNIWKELYGKKNFLHSFYYHLERDNFFNNFYIDSIDDLIQ